MKLLCKNPRWRSNSLSVIEVPKGVDSGDIVKFAFAKYNLSLGVGLSEVAGKVFRIGHLGNMDEVIAHCLHLSTFYVFMFRLLYIAVLSWRRHTYEKLTSTLLDELSFNVALCPTPELVF